MQCGRGCGKFVGNNVTFFSNQGEAQRLRQLGEQLRHDVATLQRQLKEEAVRESTKVPPPYIFPCFFLFVLVCVWGGDIV